MTKRIGILGGTFDPPHIGHLALGAAACGEAQLDSVAFVVANDPWMKSNERDITDAEHRWEMTTRAVEGVAGFDAVDCELVRGGPSYTFDTVLWFQERYQSADLVLIAGADAAKSLDRWHRAEELCGKVELALARRPGADADAEGFRLPWRLTTVDLPLLDLSSSQLRDRIHRGKSVKFLVPDAVIAYFEANELYR